MSNIKSARITGVLQDWDLYDYRYDIERVNFEVPLFLLGAFSEDEIEEMCDEGYYGGDDQYILGKLFFDCLEGGFFKPWSRWEWEDPCDLKLVIEEG